MKVAGTEEGVKEPRATFSACFGAAFIMLHPTKYAAMLASKMEKHGATGWLVNTGWSGGRCVKTKILKYEQICITNDYFLYIFIHIESLFRVAMVLGVV